MLRVLLLMLPVPLASFCLALLLATRIAVSQAPEALPSLVDTATRNYAQRSKRAEDFTYVERVQNVNYNAMGKVTLRVADSYKIVFLHGAPYRIHDAHDDRPLSPRDQKKELKKATDAAENHLHPESRSSHSLVLSMPVAQLAYQFNFTSQGEEPIEGRAAIHLHATPKAGYQPRSKEETLANALEMDLWIDRQDAQIVRLQAHILAPGTAFQPGTLVTQQFIRIGGEVWLPQQMRFRGLVQDGRKDILVETEQTYTGYQKFQVSSTTSNQP